MVERRLIRYFVNNFYVLAFVVVALIIGWVLLFVTSHGMLISSEQTGSILRCNYFTGTSVLTMDFNYAPNGLFGRAICPRLVNFGV